MNWLGFSLKGLLIAVTLAAVGVYALVHASPMWIGVVGSVTELALLTAFLAVVCRPSPRRAFWLGFAILGLGYLWFALFFEEAAILLPTGLVNERVYEVVSREGPAEGWENWKTIPPRPYFNAICHYLWSLLLALAGGFLARYFYVVQHRGSQEHGRPP